MSCDVTSSAPSGPYEVAAIYIAHKEYGEQAFADFLCSYREHPAGVDHRLVIAFKGFSGEAEAGPFKALADDLPHTPLMVPDEGLDIGTYFLVSKTIQADYYCYLNSLSVILADDWLAKLRTAFENPAVGLAGATGSLQSLAGYELRFLRPPPAWRWMAKLRRRLRYLLALRWYPPYPNPHLRTNGIMLSRALLRKLKTWPIRSKADAMRFESGWNGLSRQAARLGLAAVVVDRNGRCFRVDEWMQSGTFWQGSQSELMIADKKTKQYSTGTPMEREQLASYAWQAP